MKKYLIILALLASMPLFANHVDPETAQKVATIFLTNNDSKATQLTDLSKEAGFKNLYIFSTDGSFVVMSADDCVKPILGYSLTEAFVTEDLPDNFKSWLQGYSDEIQYAIDHQFKASLETVQQWKDLAEGQPNAAKTTIVVAPLIQTQWNQESPYNNLCPSQNNNRAVTGCVATAMAQIMKYWNYPTRGIGTHSYQYSTYGTITADFGATLYDWDNMTNTYSSTSTTAQKTAVATLMYHCGVSVEMQYSPDESGSNISRSSIGMKTYFNYNTSYIVKSKFTEEGKWADTLKYELDNGRPILYAGSGTDGGHAFVCDGYNSDGYFHFNWGWSRYYTTYFPLGSLNPGGQNYSTNQLAVISIYPLTDATTPIVLTNSQATLTWTDSQNCNSYNIYRNDALIANTTELSFTDPNPLYGSNKYYIRGLSNATLTLPSNYSTVNIDFPTPKASNLHIDLSDDSAAFSWDASDWCFPSTADAETFSYVDEERQNNFDANYGWAEGDFVLSWGHRYPAEILTSYEGKVIHEVSFFSMYPGAFDIVVYQDTEDDHPVEEMARKSITTARIGWSRVDFVEPVIIDNSKDLWIFVINTDCRIHNIYYKTINTANGSYYSGSNPTEECRKLAEKKPAWLIRAYLTDGAYTYNLYDGTTKLNGDVPISGTSYNITEPLSEGIHQFTVKTNYYDGESDASNKAGVTVGAPSLEALALDNDDVMTVTSGSTLTVTGSITNNDPANLVIEDGAQLIHPSSAVNATLKKTINAYSTEEGVNDGWYTIASPVKDYSLDNITLDDYDLYAYDEKEVYWRNQENTSNNITEFAEGKGLLYANATNQSLPFAGNMKASDEQVTVTLSCQSNDANLKGFNLVGNPFSRNLCNGDITLGGEPLTTYYSVEGGSELVSHNINDDPIKPGQGFLVQAATDGQSLVFNPSPSKGQTEVKPSYIIIEAGDKSFTDRAFVQFREGNTLHKTTLHDNTAKLSVRHQNADFATVTIDATENEMPINFEVVNDGTFSINVAIENLDFDYFHLIDNLTGADVDLLTTPSYNFQAKTSDYKSRFRLLLSERTGNDNITDNLMEGKTEILDMTGRVVANDRNAQLTTGVYIVRTVNGNDIKTEKIVIR